MDIILYFFRDTISGTYYFMYAFVCLLLMFSLIGYLFKDKYAKVTINLGTNTNGEEPKRKVKKTTNKKEVNHNQSNITTQPINQQSTQVNYRNIMQPNTKPISNQPNNNTLVNSIPEIK